MYITYRSLFGAVPIKTRDQTGDISFLRRYFVIVLPYGSTTLPPLLPTMPQAVQEDMKVAKKAVFVLGSSAIIERFLIAGLP